MTLFETSTEPSGTRPKLYTESTYKYLRDSERVPVSAIRDLLESWFAEFPQSEKLDVSQRFRSSIERQHGSALFEMYLHHFLNAAGFTVVIHPVLEGTTTHPDFLVLRNDLPVFYFEAIVVGDTTTENADSNRINVVYDTLNQLTSPDFFLSVHVDGAPATSPSGAKLRRDLKQWLESLSWEEVTQRFQSGGFDALPTYSWEHEGWELEFQPIPKSRDKRGSNSVRAIGLTAPMKAQIVSLDEMVKDAVNKKNKYGKLSLPLVLAIQIDQNFSVDTYDVMNGLVGTEQIVVNRDHTYQSRRALNGAWTSPQGPQHTTVSAVLVWSKLNTWSLKSAEPITVHNPWAAKPLAADVFPTSQHVANLEKNIHELRAGVPFSSFLGLPDPWPPLED